MAGKIKRKKNHKLSFIDKLYLPGILKGMLYTIKQIFAPKITTEYPEKKWSPEGSFRGRPVLVERDDKTGERCVACGLCARVCPPLAINIVAEETELEQERYPSIFEIDMLRCIYCGYCEEVCPEEAIIMSQEYDNTFSNRTDSILSKEVLLISSKDAKPRLEFLKKNKNKSPLLSK